MSAITSLPFGSSPARCSAVSESAELTRRAHAVDQPFEDGLGTALDDDHGFRVAILRTEEA